MGTRRYGSGRGGPSDRDVTQAVNAFMRLDPRARVAVVVLLVIVGAVAAVVYYRQQHRGPVANAPTSNTSTAPGTEASPQSAQMLLGNPSGATADAANRDNYLLVKPYYALSYNNAKGTPNWVSWRVTASDLGSAQRKQLFDSETKFPPGFKLVTHRDYSGSGFDRGHMCPHGDRAATQEMAFSTFVMSNIIPQAANVNQKAWNQLEMYCRDQARREHQRLYVVSGPNGRGGRGLNGPAETIGGGRVTVPTSCWKVIVAVPEGGGDDDLAKIGPASRVIAVDMPNDNDVVGDEWAKFRISPATIEGRTGLKFFDRVRPEVAEALRQKVDGVRVAAPRAMNGDRE